jgi:type I restriction-modification system DNA methylase subunit/predicted type IV restriction endonuclease
MNAPARVRQLVETFSRNIEAYKRGAYNETQVRREFIDPFFEALGWDVTNQNGYAEAYKDVIHEDAIKVGGVTKAPDYCFRIGGARKFFLEAKKPSVNIAEDLHPAFQLRRYGWSAKLPLSILTDFEELAVYDCRIKPVKTDKVSHSRILYLTYTDYVDRWEEISGIFSREAVLKGSFDKYIESAKIKKGTTGVDAAFLQEIERWRDMLARNIALRNPALSQRQLNFAVQQTIDRVVFLRICEDRGMEPYGALMALRNGENVYRRLFILFTKADAKYNSGLFHFKKEPDRENCDALTPSLQVDDKPLKDIFKNLYYPESPYEFSVLPADILGQVYEKFLGKVIRLTAGHQAKIEEKPEVRKAGGVYYTPAYIVDYIVKNTVGRLVEDKKPGPRGGVSQLRILDPACGSGSFLIGAYQFLLDWHRDAYAADDPPKWAKGKTPRLYQSRKGEWRLTTDERKRILINNIYGVDIDPQAVEVTKLSLLLKVLEGEDEESMGKQMYLIQERVLPDLSANIKCGNSLIGPDFYTHHQTDLFDEAEMYRVNAFDWQAEFAEIMKGGGFDAVIGNPPYGATFTNDEKTYIKSTFETYRYRFDSYIYFIEKAIKLSKSDGFISFITPELWLKLENCNLLRSFIASNLSLEKIRICGENIFSKAIINTIIFVLKNTRQTKKILIELQESSWELSALQWASSSDLSIEYRITPERKGIIEKIYNKKSITLNNYGTIIQGITPYDKYQGQSEEIIKNKAYHFESKKDDTCDKWLEGKDVGRYALSWSGRWLSYGPWLAAPREPNFFTGERLLFREVPGAGKRIQAVYTEETYYHGHSITPLKPDKNRINCLFLLGIVNSNLLSWYGSIILPNFGKQIFPKLNPKDIKKIPIRTIDFDDPADKARHDRMVGLVGQMLELNKKLATAVTPQEKSTINRRIQATDQQIDQLVYDLYDLTPEEIALVEADRG